MKTLSSISSNVEYKLIREIAHGGMGSVYEAEQLGVEGFVKRVAIKTILDKYTDDQGFIERFIGEAKLVANLVHPNIVQIYQLDKYQNGYYIAMEYINGITCHRLLQMHKEINCPIPVDYVSFIISRIARGLEYAHNRATTNNVPLGIVHRDVCPKNIMINSEGEGKLTDFGIAKAHNILANNEGRTLFGKVQYMSPEQANMEITDSRSDIFSLGIVYFELLTGESPFKSSSPIKTLQKVRKAELPDPKNFRPDIPDDLITVLTKMLEKYPDDRYSNSSELSTDIETMMYSKGFGPTIKKLSSYLYNTFPSFANETLSGVNTEDNLIQDYTDDVTTMEFKP